MNILRASHLGMCFGVRDAIALAKHQSHHGPFTVLGELVHNETVLRDLAAHGIRFTNGLNGVTTPTVMITAHGAAERTIEAAKRGGFDVMEATCPLVHAAHRALKLLVQQGCHPVIIGKRDHVEVRGMTGDLDEFDVILSEDDVRQLTPKARFGVVAQTTQPVERVQHLVRLLRQTFPQSEVEFRDTVCQPTKQRQQAAVDIARQSDVVIVIGGNNSNNTRELVSTCSRYCSRVHHVQTAADLRAEWLRGVNTVGVTAGTSTPDHIITQVDAALHRLAAELATAPCQ